MISRQLSSAVDDEARLEHLTRIAVSRVPTRPGSIVLSHGHGLWRPARRSTFTGSARALYQWARTEGLDAAWVRPPGASEPIGSTITLNRPSGLLRAARAHVAVGGSNSGIPWPILSDRTWVVQAWHGTPLKTLGSQNPNVKFRDSRIRMRADAFVSSGPEFTERMRRCYQIPEERFWELGNPRNDRLLLASPDDVAGLRVRLTRVVGQEFSTVVLYAPTYRDWGAPIGLLQLPQQDLERLAAFLARRRCLLVVRPHDNEAETFARTTLPSRWIVAADRIAPDWDVNDWLLAAQVLVTDYSSIAFDYLLLNRPVIHLAPDLDEYAKRRGFLVDPESDWCGPRVRDGSELIDALEGAIQEPQAGSSRRRYLNSIFNPLEDGRSTERVGESILRLIAAGPRQSGS